MGTLIFFDDYANTMVVGGAMLALRRVAALITQHTMHLPQHLPQHLLRHLEMAME